MYHFVYVTKKEAAPIKNELISLINEVQDILRQDFTFQYRFIGSSRRNMITHDVRSNIGFDFDVNIEVNDDEDNYSAEEIRKRIYKALNKVAKKYGYDFPEESTRVLTIKLKDRKRKRVIHSCDFAVVYNCDDGRQQYIRYNKQRNNYTWEYTSVGFKNIEEKIEYIKENNLQAELKDIFLYKKNTNTDKNKHSRSIFAESVNQICYQNGYFD